VPSPISTPRLASIRLHPIKSLDPVQVSEARISPSGGLVHDRSWALYSVDGQWVNGKRTPVIHLIRANYSPEIASVTLSVPNDRRDIPTRTFAFPQDYENASEWFSVYFEQQIIVRYSPGGFPDDSIANGPTIVSTASLQAVADWFPPSHDGLPANPEAFPGLDLENVRQRFRSTLEIDSVPAFWEDQLFGEDELNIVRFTIGEVQFEGSNPCARCPVPPRDPQTGIPLIGFQKHFVLQREATLPPWSPRDRFDHFYRLSTNTRVASTNEGKQLARGDPLKM
jgi:uncharacterized protein